MNEYFIHDGHAQHGPFTLEQLQGKQLTAETPIWYEGLEKWVTIGSLPELKSLLLKKATPPPIIPVFDSKPVESEETKQASYATAMEQYFPTEKKRSFRIPIIVGSIVLVAIVIFWLINKNNQNSDTIEDLQQQVSEQKQDNEQKRLAEQQKVDEAKRTNDALAQKNLDYRKNWDRYIKEQHSEPKIDYGLGGISAFNVYVTNETEYILDQVDIFVQYIRKNGEVWRTKTITLLNVAANSTETKVAPSSVNGVKVSVEIQKIICKKMQFCYPAYNGNKSDPFFCK